MLAILFLLAPSGKLRAHLCGVGIFDLLKDGECLFGVLDGLRALAELVHCQTHIPQPTTFGSAVANLAGDSQALFIELNGAAGLAQVFVGNA